jgi:hypothetical protein
MADTQSADGGSVEPTAKDPNVSVVGVIVEVAAENEDQLREKLFAPDDIVAQCRLIGHEYDELYGNHEQSEADDILREEMRRQDYTMEDVYELQEEHTTVSEQINNAVINGHPVLTITGGDFGVDGFSEIPHFNHGASHCEDTDKCREDHDSGGVFRTFEVGDLVLQGDSSLMQLAGSYKISDDVLISITKCHGLNPGENQAEPFDS